jgi:hypothetical protein
MKAPKIVNLEVSFYKTKEVSKNRRTIVLEAWGICQGIQATKVVSDLDSPEQRDIFSSFETSNGLLVCCYSLVEHYDELWILYGSKVLMVLRVADDGHRSFSSAIVIFDKDRTSETSIFSIADIMEEVKKGKEQRRRISLI